jgi:hypothetical protein
MDGAFEAALQELPGEISEGDAADARDEAPVDVIVVAVRGRLAQVWLDLGQPVPQPTRHSPRPRCCLFGRAVEDGLPGCGSRLPGREPAPPVAGLPPADGGDLHRVVPAAVPRLDEMRAVALGAAAQCGRRCSRTA